MGGIMFIVPTVLTSLIFFDDDYMLAMVSLVVLFAYGILGVNKLMFTRNKTDAHVSYLMKMGFEDQNDSYIKKIG